MFEGLPKSVNKLEFEILFVRRVAEKVPNYNTPILEILARDPNNQLHNLFSEYLNKPGEERSKIGLEDLESYIGAHVWNAEGEIVYTYNIGTDTSDTSIEIVDTETYAALKTLCTDIESIRVDEEFKLKDVR